MEVNDNDKTAVSHARNNIYTAEGIDRFYYFLIDTYLKETYDKMKCGPKTNVPLNEIFPALFHLAE